MVYTRAIADTGMITIKTYHQDKATADKINQAIAYTLMTKHSQYHGLGENVKIKIINDSTLSDWPVKPNIILNLFLGLIAGLAAGLYFIYLFPSKAIGFNRRQRINYAAEPFVETPVENQAAYEPELAYEPAQVLNEIAEDEASNELDIEEAGEEDEFEPYFKGSINNVIR